MSIKAMMYVWQSSKQRGSALVVMLALADMANDDGECYPGKARLSDKCRLKVRNLAQILSKLEAAGEVVIYHRRDGQFHQTNVYKVVMNQEGGSDLQIRGVMIPRSVGSDPQIMRGDDPQIIRSLIFKPNESKEIETHFTNPIIDHLKQRGDRP